MVLTSPHIVCSDNERKYKYVSVQSFISAFVNTETAKRTQSRLQTPPVINEKAENPLVRELSIVVSTVPLHAARHRHGYMHFL
jgi:hypothetical protein